MILCTNATESPLERLSRSDVHLPQNVGIGVHRSRNCTMSEPLLYNFRLKLNLYHLLVGHLIVIPVKAGIQGWGGAGLGLVHRPNWYSIVELWHS